MEQHFISLLKVSGNKPSTIKRVVANSNMLETHKPSYAVKLINLARQHNLL